MKHNKLSDDPSFVSPEPSKANPVADVAFLDRFWCAGLVNKLYIDDHGNEDRTSGSVTLAGSAQDRVVVEKQERRDKPPTPTEVVTMRTFNKNDYSKAGTATKETDDNKNKKKSHIIKTPKTIYVSQLDDKYNCEGGDPQHKIDAVASEISFDHFQHPTFEGLKLTNDSPVKTKFPETKIFYEETRTEKTERKEPSFVLDGMDMGPSGGHTTQAVQKKDALATGAKDRKETRSDVDEKTPTSILKNKGNEVVVADLKLKILNSPHSAKSPAKTTEKDSKRKEPVTMKSESAREMKLQQIGKLEQWTNKTLALTANQKTLEAGQVAKTKTQTSKPKKDGKIKKTRRISSFQQNQTKKIEGVVKVGDFVEGEEFLVMPAPRFIPDISQRELKLKSDAYAEGSQFDKKSLPWPISPLPKSPKPILRKGESECQSDHTFDPTAHHGDPTSAIATTTTKTKTTSTTILGLDEVQDQAVEMDPDIPVLIDHSESDSDVDFFLGDRYSRSPALFSEGTLDKQVQLQELQVDMPAHSLCQQVAGLVEAWFKAADIASLHVEPDQTNESRAEVVDEYIYMNDGTMGWKPVADQRASHRTNETAPALDPNAHPSVGPLPFKR